MNRSIQPFLVLLSLGFLLLAFGGCAYQSEDTVELDIKRSQNLIDNLQKNISDLRTDYKNLAAKSAKNEAKIDAFQKNIDDLRQEVNTMGAESKSKTGSLEQEIESANQPMRRYQAELGNRLDKLQMDVQKLAGSFDEAKYFSQKTSGESKSLKEGYQAKFDDIDKRFTALSKSLEDLQKRIEDQQKDIRVAAAEAKAARSEALRIEKVGKEARAEKAEPAKAEKVEKAEDQDQEAAEEAPSTSSEKPEQPQPPPPKKIEKAEKVEKPEKAEKTEKAVKKPIAGPDEAYKKAYDQYTKGDISAAKTEFKRFLEVYPQSKYAENVHYWLGECYFTEKKYDEAILEFDEVIKKYPKGGKVPDALLRQGIAFLEMNDTLNAKLILKEVVKRYPNSEQAARARKKLKEL